MSTGARERILWVDYARGVGIVLVVLGHTFRGLHTGGILGEGGVWSAIDAWMYRFHMPLFFLLSGLFAERRAGRAAGAFLSDAFATIAYPYFVWSTLQTLVQVAISRHANNKAHLSDLAGIVIEPIFQFWFLYALFLIALIYYVLRRCGLGPSGALATFTAFWATRGWVPLGGWSPLNAARASGIYYALGSALGHFGWTAKVDRAPSVALAPIVALGYAVVAASVAWRWSEPPLLALGVTLCGIAASVALAALLARTPGTGIVRILGEYSLEIYVAHTIASAGLRIALQKGLKINDPSVHIAIGTIGGLALPLALGVLCRRFHAEFLFRFPRRKPGKDLGGPRRESAQAATSPA